MTVKSNSYKQRISININLYRIYRSQGFIESKETINMKSHYDPHPTTTTIWPANVSD